MKFNLFLIAFAICAPSVLAQTDSPNAQATRPRVVTVGTAPSPTPPRVVVVTGLPKPAPSPDPVRVIRADVVPVAPSAAFPVPSGLLSLAQLRSKISEARRDMAARPVTIAMTDATAPVSPIETVRVAFFDSETQRLDYVTMTKADFLTKDVEFRYTSENRKPLRFRTIRPNGVNTPVSIVDMKGQAQIPIMVQYPVVRNGVFIETAYYMSTHPGVVTPEVVNAGKLYVRNTIDTAREKLRQKGIAISAKSADIAERLAVVEHVDHLRFRTEYHPQIYNDIFTLYALNEGQTYRYSVSSAGAGGMIQMIPSTYRIIRNRYPTVGLMPDFVTGMQNHANAAQAMLLYIQLTYDDLMANATVAEAVRSGIATEFELMAAGYNSNPARLPGYIRRGGAGWKNLIPRETKIYLSINESLDRFVPIVPRSR